MRKSLLIEKFIRLSSVMFVLAALLTNLPIVKADTIFSTFGPGDTYDATQGAGIFGPPNPVQNIAASFTPSSDYFFDSADLPLLMYPFTAGAYTSNMFYVWLMSDSGGLPNSIIESFSGSIPFDSAGIYTFSSASHPLLASGTTYWLAVSPNGPVGMAWLANNQGFTNYAVGHLGPPFGIGDYGYPTPAFRVEGTTAPVPEPSTMLLLGSGLIGLVGYGKRRLFKK